MRRRRRSWLNGGLTPAARLAAASLSVFYVDTYLLCLALSQVTATGFLSGLVVAFPLSLLAARRIGAAHARFLPALWLGVAFSVTFWSSAGVTAWKVGLGKYP